MEEGNLSRSWGLARRGRGGQASSLLLLLLQPQEGGRACGSDEPERAGSRLCPSVSRVMSPKHLTPGFRMGEKRWSLGAAPTSPCVSCHIQILGTRRGGETPSAWVQVQPRSLGQSWWMFLYSGLVPACHSKHRCPDNTLPERQGPVLSAGVAGPALRLPSLGLGFFPEQLGWVSLGHSTQQVVVSSRAQAESITPPPTPPRALGHADHAETFRGPRGHFQLDTESFLETIVKAVCHILCPHPASRKDWASLREEADLIPHGLWAAGLERAGSWLTPRPREYLTLHNKVRMVGCLLQVGQQPRLGSRQSSGEGIITMSMLGAQTSAGTGDEVAVGMRSLMYQQEMRV